MANAPKNRFEIQVVWPSGRWRMEGPRKGIVMSREQLVQHLRDALETIAQLPPEAERGKP